MRRKTYEPQSNRLYDEMKRRLVFTSGMTALRASRCRCPVIDQKPTVSLTATHHADPSATSDASVSDLGTFCNYTITQASTRHKKAHAKQGAGLRIFHRIPLHEGSSTLRLHSEFNVRKPQHRKPEHRISRQSHRPKDNCRERQEPPMPSGYDMERPCLPGASSDTGLHIRQQHGRIPL